MRYIEKYVFDHTTLLNWHIEFHVSDYFSSQVSELQVTPIFNDVTEFINNEMD